MATTPKLVYTPTREGMELRRVEILMQRENAIFVFGSNLAGRHGAGAAAAAHKHYGATMGIGSGPTGRCYAIPTKDAQIETLPLDAVQQSVEVFLTYAAANPTLTFAVTRIGCGLAGFTDDQIGPMFKDAPENCRLPLGWEIYGDRR